LKELQTLKIILIVDFGSSFLSNLSVQWELGLELFENTKEEDFKVANTDCERVFANSSTTFVAFMVHTSI